MTDTKKNMETAKCVAQVVGLNFGIMAYINLAQTREIVTILLGVVSIISTVIIIWKNLRGSSKNTTKD